MGLQAKMRLLPINPGELTRKITIQQLTEATGDSGFPNDTWTELVEVMANRLDKRAEERLLAGQLSSPFDTKWQTWYRADIDPEIVDVPKVRRILWRDRIYDIVRATVIEISGIRHGIEFETLSSGRI